MVTYLIDFHESIRFSKTIREYQEQPYPLLHFLIHRKKNACNIRKLFIEQSGNIPIFNIPKTLFRNIPQNFMGNFFQIFWEYIMGMSHENSTNIYLPGGLALDVGSVIYISYQLYIYIYNQFIYIIYIIDYWNGLFFRIGVMEDKFV